MSNLKEGMRVQVFGEDTELLRGEIQSVYDDVAVVKLDNGEVKKCSVNKIAILNESETLTEEQPEEPDKESIKDTSEDGAKVITKNQFMDKVMYVVSPEYLIEERKLNVDPSSVIMKGLAVLCVGGNISEKLFGDKEEIEITKNELKNVIRENCNPVEIAKSINNEMSVASVFPIAVLSTFLLLEVVDKLFEDNGEND